VFFFLLRIGIRRTFLYRFSMHPINPFLLVVIKGIVPQADMYILIMNTIA